MSVPYSYHGYTPTEPLLHLWYGIAETPFGWSVVGMRDCAAAPTHRAIILLAFAESAQAAEAILRGLYPSTALSHDDHAMLLLKNLFVSGHTPSPPLTLAPRGTPFQQEVWQELCRIAPGMTISYQQVAQRMGRPTAVRAVARAIALNPIAYLIPCHRVIASSGAIHRYRWGGLRKRLLIDFERAG